MFVISYTNNNNLISLVWTMAVIATLLPLFAKRTVLVPHRVAIYYICMSNIFIAFLPRIFNSASVIFSIILLIPIILNFAFLFFTNYEELQL